jgi:hypothetical protein
MNHRGWMLKMVEALVSGDKAHLNTTGKLIPIVDDTRLELGDGTTSFDLKVFGNTTSDYMLWDASAGSMTLAGAAVLDVPAGQFQIGSTAVLATAAELNRANDVSTRLVNTTATTLAVTVTEHEGKLVTISSAAPLAVTLPAATGTGAIFRFLIRVAATGTAHTIGSTSVMSGVSIIAQTDTAQVNGFLTTATDNTISLNGSTKGGLVGDYIECIDVAANKYQVLVRGGATGTVVTPFSAV